MKTDLKRLIVSVLLWTAVNAGIVVLFEALEGSVTAEVITSALFSVLWVPFAVLFCRRAAETEE